MKNATVKPEPQKNATIKPEPQKNATVKPEPQKNATKAEPQKNATAKPEPAKKAESASDALKALAKDVKTEDSKGTKAGSKGKGIEGELADLKKGLGSGDDASGDGPGGSGGDGLGRRGAYEESIVSRVRPNWGMAQSAVRKNYTTVVQIELKQDGTILNARIIEPSGNPVFDSSVLNAIRTTQTLEPPPTKSYQNFKMTFTSGALAQ